MGLCCGLLLLLLGWCGAEDIVHYQPVSSSFTILGNQAANVYLNASCPPLCSPGATTVFVLNATLPYLAELGAPSLVDIEHDVIQSTALIDTDAQTSPHRCPLQHVPLAICPPNIAFNDPDSTANPNDYLNNRDPYAYQLQSVFPSPSTPITTASFSSRNAQLQESVPVNASLRCGEMHYYYLTVPGDVEQMRIVVEQDPDVCPTDNGIPSGYCPFAQLLVGRGACPTLTSYEVRQHWSHRGILAITPGNYIGERIRSGVQAGEQSSVFVIGVFAEVYSGEYTTSTQRTKKYLAPFHLKCCTTNQLPWGYTIRVDYVGGNLDLFLGFLLVCVIFVAPLTLTYCCLLPKLGGDEKFCCWIRGTKKINTSAFPSLKDTPKAQTQSGYLKSLDDEDDKRAREQQREREETLRRQHKEQDEAKRYASVELTGVGVAGDTLADTGAGDASPVVSPELANSSLNLSAPSSDGASDPLRLSWSSSSSSATATDGVPLPRKQLKESNKNQELAGSGNSPPSDTKRAVSFDLPTGSGTGSGNAGKDSSTGAASTEGGAGSNKPRAFTTDGVSAPGRLGDTLGRANQFDSKATIKRLETELQILLARARYFVSSQFWFILIISFVFVFVPALQATIRTATQDEGAEVCHMNSLCRRDLHVVGWLTIVDFNAILSNFGYIVWGVFLYLHFRLFTQARLRSDLAYAKKHSQTLRNLKLLESGPARERVRSRSRGSSAGSIEVRNILGITGPAGELNSRDVEQALNASQQGGEFVIRPAGDGGVGTVDAANHPHARKAPAITDEFDGDMDAEDEARLEDTIATVRETIGDGTMVMEVDTGLALELKLFQPKPTRPDDKSFNETLLSMRTRIRRDPHIFYAIALSEIFVGIMSSVFHICQTTTYFQFDDTYQIFITACAITSLYHRRHADTIQPRSYFAFICVIYFLHLLGDYLAIFGYTDYFWLAFAPMFAGVTVYGFFKFYYGDSMYSPSCRMLRKDGRDRCGCCCRSKRKVKVDDDVQPPPQPAEDLNSVDDSGSSGSDKDKDKDKPTRGCCTRLFCCLFCCCGCCGCSSCCGQAKQRRARWRMRQRQCCSMEHNIPGCNYRLWMVCIMIVVVTAAIVGCARAGIAPSWVFLYILLLAAFMYMLYYLSMKMHFGERILSRVIFLFFMFVIIVLPILVIFYVFAPSSTGYPYDWSRNLNRECWVSVFDSHDIWHFGSAYFLSFLALMVFHIDDDVDDYRLVHVF